MLLYLSVSQQVLAPPSHHQVNTIYIFYYFILFLLYFIFLNIFEKAVVNPTDPLFINYYVECKNELFYNGFLTNI
jgi:hypothetical protein